MAKGIASLFNSIAGSYDKLNHIFSLNIDKLWRKRALRGHVGQGTHTVLDVACGTGDFSIQLIKSGVERVVGVDVSEGMLEVGKRKISDLGLSQSVSLQLGDCAALTFADNTFDAATVAFGVRNFAQRPESLRELHRVLKPGSEVIILEFSQPSRFPMKQLYRFYFKHIMPTVGGWVSGNKAAYEYLPNSVYAFPQGDAFLAELGEAGFSNLQQCRMTFGIATTYYGTK